MKIGDNVRIESLPAELPKGELKTRSLFALCVGRVFPIVGFQGSLVELEVGEVVGEESYMHSIWIEPEHVEVVAIEE